ncbi:MAG TPA: hypothetical protein VFR99_00320 [Marmoricola sp.]|nr:hypothetical protein [Marmoricola sp.]
MSTPTQNPPQSAPLSRAQDPLSQPPLAAPPAYPPTDSLQVYPELPRRAVWPWVLGSVLATALVFLGVGLGALLWVADQQPHVSDARVVYEEHFGQGPGRFPEFTQAQTGTHAAAARDGAYVVTSSSQESSSTATAAIDPADVVDVSAVATLTRGNAQGAGTGLIVTVGTSRGYLFEVVPSVGVRLGEVSADQVETLATAEVPVVASTARLRLTVEHGLGSTTLVGYLDGARVVDVLVGGGWGGFDRAGVVLYTGRAPAAMTVDDVVVKSAGEVSGS